jgi:hypothetical protein
VEEDLSIPMLERREERGYYMVFEVSQNGVVERRLVRDVKKGLCPRGLEFRNFDVF